jgi:hypothetical protein
VIAAPTKTDAPPATNGAAGGKATEMTMGTPMIAVFTHEMIVPREMLS